MYAFTLPAHADEAAFRTAARHCLALKLSPNQVTFVSESEGSLLPQPPPPKASQLVPFNVPRAFNDLLADAICHSAPDRFALLYDVLWRLLHGERWLAERPADPAVGQLGDYAKNVRRDIHKMHAFLRFRPRETDHGTVYTAWFEPQHHILKRAVPFFVDRFTGMDWLIATPRGAATWTDGQLTYGPPPERKPEQNADAVLDELWLTYYRTTFNPARVRTKAMLNQMPKLYWPNMPEARAIPDLVAGAQARVGQMHAREADQPELFAERIAAREHPAVAIPETSLDALRAEAVACQRCPLHRPATQTVFGHGPIDSPLVFVGEQPGDEEDLAGLPFVGPAGQVFNRALQEAGIDRTKVYVTNAVKHFKYEPRGKRRLHSRPNVGEIETCRWWLDRELVSIKPDLIVALGATAARALSGRAVSVTKERGVARFRHGSGLITVHPSYLLRLPSEQDKAVEYNRFVEDLRQSRILVPKVTLARHLLESAET
jgi:probable DNA metabolism protein